MIRHRRILLMAAVAIVSAAPLAAQQSQPAPPAPPVPPAPPAVPAPPSFGFAAIEQAPTFEFIAAQPAFRERTVTGAPYSAETVSETVRILADGTRIKNENTSKIYRDSEGRVRKEQSFGHIGFWVPEGGSANTMITITDPVAKKTILLNPHEKTARVLPMPPMPEMPPLPPPPPDGATGNVIIERRSVELGATGASEGDQVVRLRVMRKPGTDADGTERKREDRVIEERIVGAPVGSGAMELPRQMMQKSVFDPKNVSVEKLGEQTVQGVKASGTRTTTTIPLGAIGNDRPIVSVMEQWTSPELGVVVRRTLRDPQIGETDYRLENIDRSEPLKSLFEVPAGYQVQEAQPRMQRVEIRKRSDGE
ncbi:MAG: hypothetical protein KJZ70_11900 [Bryobacterales bacterium]|nr:hypothetical protein [Bryobacterales bacterium]